MIAPHASDLDGLNYVRKWPTHAWTTRSQREALLSLISRLFKKYPLLRRWKVREERRNGVRLIKLVLIDNWGRWVVDLSFPFESFDVLDASSFLTRLSVLDYSVSQTLEGRYGFRPSK